jgi:hypothetical protein
LQVLAVDQAGASANSPVFGKASTTNPTTEIALDASDILIGITGKFGQYIDNIVLHTNNDDPSAPPKRLGHDGGPIAYSMLEANLPIGADIVGIYGSVSNDNISSIGLVCQVPGPPAPLLLDQHLKWLDSTAKKYPVPDDSVGPAGDSVGTDVPPQGNYLAPVLYRVELVGKTLNIWSESGLFHTLQFQHVTSAIITDDTVYLYHDEQGHDVRVKMPGSTLGYIEVNDKLKLESANQYSERDSTEPTFGHVFSTNTESAFDQAPFLGWDVTLINPQHLQDTPPLCHNVFTYPDDNSRAYHKSEWGNQKEVPNGVMYVSKIRSDELSRTNFASTERDFQSSWKTSFGAKLGMGDVTIFKANTEFRNSLSKSMSTAASSTVSVFTLYSHALFVDLPRVTLDPAFAADVNALADATTLAPYTMFINTYGTHFAFAVTYGARAYMEMFFSKQATLDALSKGTTVEEEVGGVFDGLTGSANVSMAHDTSITLKNEIQKQTSHFTTEGGVASTGGHLSVTEQTAVPILLDLRPLTTLLNPVFFTDPRIFTAVRPKLEKAMIDWGAGRGSDFGTETNLPPTLRVTITSGRWKDINPPTGVDINMTCVPLAQESIKGKVLGFDNYSTKIGILSSTVWSQNDPSILVPKLNPTGKTVELGITKNFQIAGSIPEIAIQLDGSKSSSSSSFGYAILKASDFTREPRGGIVDCGTWEFAYQYQLIGKDITFEKTTAV